MLAQDLVLNHNQLGSVYIISRMFREYISQQWTLLLITIVCMLINAGCTTINAWLIKPIFDGILTPKNNELITVAWAIVLNCIIKGIASFFQAANSKIIGQKFTADLQMHLYKHLIYADSKFLMEYPSGNLISRFTNDINAMRRSVCDSFIGAIFEICTIVGLIGSMLYHSFRLSIIVFIILPLALFCINLLSKRIRKISHTTQEELTSFTVHLDETFQNTPIIKSYCREDYEITKAQTAISRFVNLRKRAAYVESLASPLMETLTTMGVATVFVYASSQVFLGKNTPGAFLAFLTALLMIYKPLKQISFLHNSLQEGVTAARRLFAMLDSPATIQDPAHPQTFHKHNYTTCFKDVKFSYKDEYMILDNFNITIPHGKTVALVGTSGSGKSTIFNLMQRLYDPDHGCITVGGIDITKLTLQKLRSSIALVSQEIALFDDSIGENIRYGRLEASQHEIIAAATAAAAHDFIMDMPQGYNTAIGQHGTKLSGGQRQRIAIARAILKNAPILLLDEATSALDTISEKQIQTALTNLKRGRTTIVIAHRLSTIESADLIYFIEDGKVIESGQHDQLLKQNGAYHTLYTQYKNAT